MSLRIWLPLNNSFENRGIDGASVTTGGVFETPGKLSAYCWRSSARISVPYTYGSTERLSVAMWLKPNSAVAWSSIFGWGNTSTRANRVEIDADGSAGYYFFGTGDCLVASNTRITKTGLPNAVWSHFAMTADGTTVRFYINGIQVNSVKQKSQVSATFDGTNTFYFGGYKDNFNGYYNDVRVYDHALSQKEVVELAKGLMLHIPMYAGYPGIGTNIAKSTSSTPVAYSIGQNYTQDADTDTNFYGLKAGDTFTFCFKVTAPADRGIFARVQYYTDNDHRTSVINSNTIPAGTTGYTYLTSTISASQRGYTQMELLINNSNNSLTTSATCYVSEVKLERGSVRTPWSPDASSSQFTSDYSIKDCSGYQVPIGTTGTVPSVTGDSPRYGMSASFDGAGTCLWPIQDPINSSTQEFTISVWFKTTTTSGNQCIWNGRTTTGAAVGIFLIGSGIRVDDSNMNTSGSVSTNTWYHLAVTWKSGGNKVIYLNGEQKTTVAAGTLSKSNVNASIGRSSSGDSLASSDYFSGQMSDFRIYATALTATQVKELYDAPISVANTGACLAEQFTEGATGISFAKTGVISCNGISSLPGKYDPEVLIEPDGSCWARTIVKDGGYPDLYIRIDNVTFSTARSACSLDKGGKGVLSPEFVEQ